MVIDSRRPPPLQFCGNRKQSGLAAQSRVGIVVNSADPVAVVVRRINKIHGQQCPHCCGTLFILYGMASVLIAVFKDYWRSLAIGEQPFCRSFKAWHGDGTTQGGESKSPKRIPELMIIFGVVTRQSNWQECRRLALPPAPSVQCLSNKSIYVFIYWITKREPP